MCLYPPLERHEPKSLPSLPIPLPTPHSTLKRAIGWGTASDDSPSANAVSPASDSVSAEGKLNSESPQSAASAPLPSPSAESGDNAPAPAPPLPPAVLQARELLDGSSDILPLTDLARVLAMVPRRCRMFRWGRTYSLLQDGVGIRNFLRCVGPPEELDLSPPADDDAKGDGKDHRKSSRRLLGGDDEFLEPVSLVLVYTIDRRVFGGFAGAQWHRSPSWYGTGESFVWSFDGQGDQPMENRPLLAYKASCANRFFQYCDDSGIAMGGG